MRAFLACAVLLAGSFVPLIAAQSQDSSAVVPFKISIPNEILTDLKVRLARTRFPDELSGAGWDYGTNLDYLKQLVTYWRDRFDWRKEERRLNQWPQFKTRVDGLDIHFMHRRSAVPNALPLVMIHGWPGSFYEFTRIADRLVDPVRFGGRTEDAFHVVAVSLPGYAFSDKPRDPGFSPEKMGTIVATVMKRLGYERYGVQGGDWGSVVGRMTALNDAPHVVGLHANFCTTGAPAGVADPNAGVPPAELERVRQRQRSMQNELAYFQIQSTKPQTLGYGLNDSPAGLAAWIVEKFRAWCDCEGDVERKFTKDDLLTNISLYWMTQTITSSTRIYFENQRAGAAANSRRVTAPMACAVFPKDIVFSTRRWMEAQNNLTRWTEMPRGGHFAAMEEPELLTDDIRAFFRPLR
ncbi:MAG: epoxide hydrolase family protein [Acidobacteriota bacterium]